MAGQPCKTCGHPDRINIECHIRAGLDWDAVAAMTGVDDASSRRHLVRHMSDESRLQREWAEKRRTAPVAALEQKRQELTQYREDSLEALGGQLRLIMDRAWRLLDAMEGDADYRGAVGATNLLRLCVGDLANLVDKLAPAELPHAAESQKIRDQLETLLRRRIGQAQAQAIDPATERADRARG